MPRRRTRQAAEQSARSHRRKPRRKFSFKRLFLFIILIISVFTCSFMLAADNSDSSRQASTTSAETTQSVQDRAINKENDENPSTWTRVGRLMFIEGEVEQKLRENKRYVPLDQIPESLQQAVISVEDGHFYNHWGFDISGIIRASLVNLQYGEVKEGASTITQQLVKNMFLSQEQSFGRKIEELMLAIDIEMHYSKNEILEMYLNSIYFGSGYYGISEAAEGYFAKRPDELSLSEATMLAGVPNAPSLYSPYVDFILAKKRQIIVLDAMVKNGYLRESVAEDAKIKPIYLAH